MPTPSLGCLPRSPRQTKQRWPRRRPLIWTALGALVVALGASATTAPALADTSRLGDGVQASISFTEIEDGRIADESGNGYDATVTGDAPLTDGRYGQGLSTTRWHEDGRGRRGSSVQGAEIPIATGTEEFGVSFWFRTTDPSNGILSFVTEGSRGPTVISGKEYFLYDGDLYAQLRALDVGPNPVDETVRTEGISLADGTFHHVAHTFGGTEPQRIYVDGVVVAEGSYEGPFDSRDTQIALVGTAFRAKTVGEGSARPDGSRTFLGDLDELVIHERALTDSDVLGLMQASRRHVFPDDARVVNVLDLGVDNTGTVDATALLQSAIDDLSEKQFGRWWLYFPDGEYVVSDTLRWQRFFALQGESRDGVVIRLADASPGFGDPSAPKPVIMAGETVNESFGVYVQDLTIETGQSNPGAIGLDYLAHNLGSVRNVRIVSGDGAGVAGLQLKRVFPSGFEATPGPHMVRNLIVEGFDVGVSLGEARSGISNVVFEDVALAGQGTAGIAFTPRLHAAIRGLTSINDVPAITAERTFGAAIAITDARFHTSSESSSRSAIELGNNENRVYVENATSSGYLSLVKVRDDVIPGTTADQWLSHPAESLFSDAPPSSLGLPVRETPEYLNDDVDADWQPVVNGDVQAAMNSGRPVVYLQDKGDPTFNIFNGITDTVTIPSTVRWFNLMDQPIGSRSWIGGDNPVFRIEGTADDPPLIIERVETFEGIDFEGPIFEHVGGRTVVFKSAKGQYVAQPGAGDVFFEDYVGRDLVFQPGQRVWARQLNTEDHPGRPAPLVHNDGADVWILGHKTEGPKVAHLVENGGRTEVIGGLYFPLEQASVSDIPLFIIDDAEFSAAGYTAFFTFPIHARETRDGETRELLETSRASKSLFSAH